MKVRNEIKRQTAVALVIAVLLAGLSAPFALGASVAQARVPQAWNDACAGENLACTPSAPAVSVPASSVAYSVPLGWSWQSPIPQGNNLLSVDAIDDDIVWASGADFTIVRTVDGGANWELLTSGGVGYAGSSSDYEVVSGVSKDICWALNGSKLVKTTDGGVTWVDYYPSSFQGYGLGSVDALSENCVWVSGVHQIYGRGAIMITNDGGITWDIKDNNLRGWAVEDMDAIDEKCAWALWNNSIIYTSDGGSSWATKYPDSESGIIKIHAVDKNTIWALALEYDEEGFSSGESVIFTNNGGASWSHKPLDIAMSVQAICPLDASTALAVGYNVGGGDNDTCIWKTTDGAASWSLQYKQDTSWPEAASAADAGHIYCVGDEGLILKTSDAGATWQKQRKAVTEQNLNGVSAASANTAWVVGNGGEIFKTVDYGASWSKQKSTTSADLNDVCAVSERVAWACGTHTEYPSPAIALRTLDGGSTWNQVFTGSGVDGLSSIAAVDRNVAWAASEYGKVFKTTDGGLSWKKYEWGVTAGNFYGITATDANNAWVVGYSLFKGDVIFQTSNGGASWTERDPGWGDTLMDIEAINTSVVWAAGTGGLVLRSTDGGATWAEKERLMMHTNGLCAVSADVAWAVGDTGGIDGRSYIYKTEDGGNTWVPQGPSAPRYYNDASSADGDSVWVVGDAGIILHARGGGYSPPMITSISPGTGPTGVEVNIEGKDFGEKDGACYVSFGTSKPDIVFWSPFNTVVTAPAGESGPVKVSVTNKYGTSNAVTFVLMPTPPRIDAITPAFGLAGDEVTITGSAFGTSRGGSYVLFGSERADSYSHWSNDTIKCRVPGGGLGNVPVSVVTDTGASNKVDFEIYLCDFYFAEGYTGTGFQEYISLGNPNPGVAKVKVLYFFPGGGMQYQDIDVPPNSRATADVNAEVGEGKEVSVRILADQAIVAERPMYFLYQGSWSGGHDSVGATSLSDIWYFAEGYTGPGFEEWVCVLNPGDAPASLTFRFQTQEEGEIVRDGFAVPPHSRATFKANDILGPNYQTSLKLESSQPVVAERPMYFSYQGTGAHNWEGGHCVMGVTELADEYYLAEGTTRSEFEEWVTLQNPHNQPIQVKATYQFGPGQGDPLIRTYDVGAGRRQTLFVPEEVGTGKDVSIKLISSDAFLVERPMYFDYLGTANRHWQGGHCTIGSPVLAQEWFLAEGYTGYGFEQWLCVQNPGTEDAEVEFSYYTQEAGALAVKEETIPASSRVTILVNEHAGPEYQLSCRLRVLSGPAIVVERPMYFSFRGWDGGHDVVGYIP